MCYFVQFCSYGGYTTFPFLFCITFGVWTRSRLKLAVLHSAFCDHTLSWISDDPTGDLTAMHSDSLMYVDAFQPEVVLDHQTITTRWPFKQCKFGVPVLVMHLL